MRFTTICLCKQRQPTEWSARLQLDALSCCSEGGNAKFQTGTNAWSPETYCLPRVRHTATDKRRWHHHIAAACHKREGRHCFERQADLEHMRASTESRTSVLLLVATTRDRLGQRGCRVFLTPTPGIQEAPSPKHPRYLCCDSSQVSIPFNLQHTPREGKCAGASAGSPAPTAGCGTALPLTLATSPVTAVVSSDSCVEYSHLPNNLHS